MPFFRWSKPADNQAGSLDALEDSTFRYTDSTGQTLVLSDPKRLGMLPRGLVEKRLQSLVKQYCLSPFIQSAKTVVDIGANIGELGILVERFKGRYIAFEPESGAYRALNHNVTSSETFKLALADFTGEAGLSLKTDTADSSLLPLIRSSGFERVQVDSLDSGIARLTSLKSIDILKIDAEGFEPEVLRGASETLKIVSYCAVDAGPERNGESTAPAVINLLTEHGFQVRDCNLQRGVFLFRNNSHPSPRVAL